MDKAYLIVELSEHGKLSTPWFFTDLKLAYAALEKMNAVSQPIAPNEVERYSLHEIANCDKIALEI